MIIINMLFGVESNQGTLQEEYKNLIEIIKSTGILQNIENNQDIEKKIRYEKMQEKMKIFKSLFLENPEVPIKNKEGSVRASDVSISQALNSISIERREKLKNKSIFSGVDKNPFFMSSFYGISNSDITAVKFKTSKKEFEEIESQVKELKILLDLLESSEKNLTIQMKALALSYIQSEKVSNACRKCASFNERKRFREQKIKNFENKREEAKKYLEEIEQVLGTESSKSLEEKYQNFIELESQIKILFSDLKLDTEEIITQKEIEEMFISQLEMFSSQEKSLKEEKMSLFQKGIATRKEVASTEEQNKKVKEITDKYKEIALFIDQIKTERTRVEENLTELRKFTEESTLRSKIYAIDKILCSLTLEINRAEYEENNLIRSVQKEFQTKVTKKSILEVKLLESERINTKKKFQENREMSSVKKDNYNERK